MGFEIQIKMEHILIVLLVLFLCYTVMSRKREKFDCQEDASCVECVTKCNGDKDCEEGCDDDLECDRDGDGDCDSDDELVGE